MRVGAFCFEVTQNARLDPFRFFFHG
jgi:hypothetical protein